MKRVIALSVVWSGFVTVIASIVILQQPIFEAVKARIQNALGASGGTGGISQRELLLTAVEIVLIIFIADILILWILKKIGGSLKADVKATIKRFGGNITIAGAGLVGCFLAIAIVAFGGLYVVVRLMH